MVFRGADKLRKLIHDCVGRKNALQFSQLSGDHTRLWLQRGKFTGLVVLHLLNWCCAIHLVSEYIGRPSFMHGPSMLPTLALEGELVIEDRLSYWFNPNLKRGELIILRSPINPGDIICKRIIGLPGDTVCVDPTGSLSPSTEHVVVPKGHLWIAGDNADFSRDSRKYGPVSRSLVLGRLYARIWPWNKATIFRNSTTFLD